MRILGLEITKVPEPAPAVWHRATVTPLGIRITDMSPDELRAELLWCHSRMRQGASIYMSVKSNFKRILSTPVGVEHEPQ